MVMRPSARGLGLGLSIYAISSKNYILNIALKNPKPKCRCFKSKKNPLGEP